MMENQLSLINLKNWSFELYKWCNSNSSIEKNISCDHVQIGFLVEEQGSKVTKTSTILATRFSCHN